MNFYMRFYWIKLLKFFLSCMQFAASIDSKIYMKKNLAIHLYTNDEILWIDICHNFDISSPCNSLSLSFISSARYVMSDLQNLFFIFLSLSLSTTQTMKMFRIFIAAQIDIYFCNIYMRPSTTTTKKASFRIDDVNLLHHRQSWCWWMKWNVNDLIY